MLNIIGNKKWYFIFTLAIILPGVLALFAWGLRLSIDFTGGSRMIYQFPQNITSQNQQTIRDVFADQDIDIATLQPSENRIIVRTKPINENQNSQLLQSLKQENNAITLEEFETIGPTIGQETTWNAVKALLFASILIVLYIAWSFRSVPKPTSSWRFGITAIVALLHDVILVVGVFAILGHYLGVEIDSLFITALLTVIGFSVHDTIVVFDRVRENLRTSIDLPFQQIVNNSILQTLTRSLNTSLTTLLVLFTLFIFGGTTLQWFIFALLIGIAVGTYSSIFIASALLVVWYEFDMKRKKRQ